MWTRRALLAGASALGAGLVLPRAPLARAADARGLHLVVVTALGGWDVSYGLDPKPGAPDVDGPELDEDPDDPDDRERVSAYGDLEVMTNAVKRPAVDRFFGSWADRAALVRGLWIGSISHDACRVRTLTGSVSEARPDLAALVADAVGRDAPIPYLDVGGAAFAGELASIAGRTGRTRQLRYLLDRRLPLAAPAGSGVTYPQYVPNAEARAAQEAWLAARADAFARTWAEGPAAHRGADLVEARARAAAIRDDGPGLARTLGQGDAATLAGQVDLALELLDGGLSHTVLVDSGGNWDTHDDNREQHALHQSLFAGLDRLMTGLADAALLDRTLVVVLSEMTRTPKRNAAGGKDHWPVTSALLLGGPLAGGRVIGATDDTLDALPLDLATGRPDPAGTVLRYDHLAAGVLAAAGGDPSRWFPGVTPLGGLLR